MSDNHKTAESMRGHLTKVAAIAVGVMFAATAFADEAAAVAKGPTPGFMNFIWALVASAVVSFGIAVAVRFTIGLLDGSAFGHVIRSFILILLALFADFTCYALWSEYSWLILLSGLLPLAVVYHYVKNAYYFMRRGIVPMYSGTRLFVAAALVAIGPFALWLCHFCHVTDPSWVSIILFWLIPGVALGFFLGRRHELENFEHSAPIVDIFNIEGAKKLYFEGSQKALPLYSEIHDLDKDERLTKYCIEKYEYDEEKECLSNEVLEGMLKAMLAYLIKEEFLLTQEKNGETYYIGAVSKSYSDDMHEKFKRAEDKAHAEIERRKEDISGTLKEALDREYNPDDGN